MAKDRLFFITSLAILGILAAFLFNARNQPQTSPEAAPQLKEDTHFILVSQKELKRGTHLTSEMVMWKKIAPEEAEPTYIYKTPAVVKQLPNATTLKKISLGERIEHQDILWPQEKPQFGTESTIFLTSENNIAVALELPKESPITRFIRSGMYADIIFNSKEEIGFGTVTITLLKNIPIIATSNEDTGADYFKSDSHFVVLEVDQKQAEIISYAKNSGDLTVALSNLKQSSTTPSCNHLQDLLMSCTSYADFNSVLVTHLIRNLFPLTNINVTATPKGYIASGKIYQPQVADKIREMLEKLSEKGVQDFVDLMEVEPQQVLISVKVFEIVRDIQKRIGLNWEVLYENNGTSFAVGAVFPRPLPTDPNYFLSGDGVSGKFNLSGIIDLLKREGKGKVIAEPNLSTVSGQTAHFFSGGEFPILVPQGGSLLGTVTVEYKKFGVILEFTPEVDLNGLINLHIVPEVSSIDKQNSVQFQGFVIPSLISRRVDTTVKLWPGQSYAIAGLLKYETIGLVHSLCGLNKLPVIGPLFRSKDFVEQRTELMVVITPYLINSNCEMISYQ